MLKKMTQKGVENLADAVLRNATEDYTELAQNGAMKFLDTIDFFNSDWFETLCYLANINKHKIINYVKTVTINGDTFANVFNWFFLNWTEDKQKEVEFTSVKAVQRALMQVDAEYNADMSEGARMLVRNLFRPFFADRVMNGGYDARGRKKIVREDL